MHYEFGNSRDEYLHCDGTAAGMNAYIYCVIISEIAGINNY
jgi:hypothetical protein